MTVNDYLMIKGKKKCDIKIKKDNWNLFNNNNKISKENYKNVNKKKFQISLFKNVSQQ